MPVAKHWNDMTMAERTAEVERRNRNRAAGRRPNDDDVAALYRQPNDVRTVLVLRLSWSTLCPDNQRHAPALRGKKAVLLMTPQYRAAKKAAIEEIEKQCSGLQHFFPNVRVKVAAMLYEPDRRTRRDVGNYVKMVHDCLTDSGVIGDDSVIDELRWTRGAPDIDAPRLMLTITAID